MAYVYKITNLVENKSYIGVSIDYKKRWQQHKRELRKNKHCNYKLQLAWNKYGEDSFQFQLIEECPYENLFNEEIRLISLFDTYKNGYNLTRGGDKGGSEACSKPVYVYDLQGQYVCSFVSKSEAERELNCHSIKECCLKYCRRGFSKTNQTWYQFSYDYAEKMNPYIPLRNNTKIVYKLDETGKILKIYPSLAEANRSCGIISGAHNIRDANATHKKFHGYYWCYQEDYTPEWEPYQENHIAVFLLDGTLVGYYHNATHAAQELHIDHSSISKVLRGEWKQCYNMIFRKIDE